MARIKTGDTVIVIAGKHKGHKGKVVEILSANERVRVEGGLTHKRHLKPQKDAKHPEGGIVEKLGSVHMSNVMPWSEKLARGCRVGVSVDAKGQKTRVLRGES